MILAATGHRPNKIGGYSVEAHCNLVCFAKRALVHFKPDTAISGMALGWDQAFAEAAIELEIPVLAAVPFKGQESQWPGASQYRYKVLLNKCSEVVIVCEGGYEPRKMQVRNEFLCRESTDLLALWNGTFGGTANCVAFAKSIDRNVINVWTKWEEFNALQSAKRAKDKRN